VVSDGKELFYESGNGRLVTVSVIPRPGLSLGFGAPMESSSGFFTHAVNNPRSFDILPNGKQFIGFVTADSAGSPSAATPQLQVVLNWFEDVKQHLPAK
jgi:hypothetical protein